MVLFVKNPPSSEGSIIDLGFTPSIIFIFGMAVVFIFMKYKWYQNPTAKLNDRVLRGHGKTVIFRYRMPRAKDRGYHGNPQSSKTLGKETAPHHVSRIKP